MRLLDLATGICEKTFQGHTESVTSVAVTKDDSTKIVSGSIDTNVRIWDITTGMCEKTGDGHFEPVTSVALSKDGTNLALGIIPCIFGI